MRINLTMTSSAQWNDIQPVFLSVAHVMMVVLCLLCFASGTNKGVGWLNSFSIYSISNRSMSLNNFGITFIIFLVDLICFLRMTPAPRSLPFGHFFSMARNPLLCFFVSSYLFIIRQLSVCIIIVLTITNFTSGFMSIWTSFINSKLFNRFGLTALRTSLIHVSSTRAKCLLLHGSSMKQKAEYSLSQFRLLDPSEIYLRDYITKGELS